MSELCACGLNPDIWQNPWNHAKDCSMRPAAAPATPDRPGDGEAIARPGDQQQVAEDREAVARALADRYGDWIIGATGANGWHDFADTVVPVVAAVRAEEAARRESLVADLREALIDLVLLRHVDRDGSRRLRAVLNGER